MLKPVKTLNIQTVQIEGVDTNDYPDFCDAFIAYAEWNDGTILTEDECEWQTNMHPDIVNQLATESCY